MEKLVIHVPEAKSALVKALLKELGVTVEQEKFDMEAYRRDLLQISTWTDEEVKVFEETIKQSNTTELQE